MVTIAILIFFAAIIVSFSKEFGAFFKKIVAIPGAKLFLPLLLVTWVVVLYEPWVLWGLLCLQQGLQAVIDGLASLISFLPESSLIAALLIILAITLVPVFTANLYIQRKSYQRFQYFWISSALLWLFTSILFALNY